MTREVPTLDLEQVDVLANSQNPAYQYFHTFGLFKQEFQNLGKVSWTLYDEIKELNVRLGGPLDEYPRPKPGDVVRIHRLSINKRMKTPEIPNPRNVVIWSAFKHEPQPITNARSPTITDDDNQRRRILETYFTSKINRVREYQLAGQPLGSLYVNVAGCFEESKLDIYGHLEINFTDGTGQSVIRVFKKTNDLEVSDHYELAENLRKGDYFVATNLKIDRNGERVNLSANKLHGRSLRQVEQASILGALLTKQLGSIHHENSSSNNNNNINDTNHNINTNSGGNEISPTSGGVTTRRRSPRLLQRESQPTTTTTTTTTPSGSQDNQNDNYSENSPSDDTPLDGPIEITPTFTPFSELKAREFGYEFHDIVGQIRDEPHPSTQYGNFILQIYDGSQHNLTNYHLHEIKHLVEGCLVLYIYSKQKETDTDEHVENARKLKEGDLIYVRNVRVSFKSGKVKLELSANKNHNKSISVIDKDSRFGRRFLDIVETPPVEELREMIDPSYSSSQE